MYQGRYDEALLELDRGAAIEPNHPLLTTFRAQVLLLRGEHAIAARLLEQVLTNNPEMEGIRPLLAQALSALGKHEAARAQLTERVHEVALFDHDIPYWLASAYAMEGSVQQAFWWLGKAISLGNANLPWFRSNPAWETLRNDSQFEALMQQVDRDLRSRSHAP
jgi:predicted Zn-dependent protease